MRKTIGIEESNISDCEEKDNPKREMQYGWSGREKIHQDIKQCSLDISMLTVIDNLHLGSLDRTLALNYQVVVSMVYFNAFVVCFLIHILKKTKKHP